MKNKNYSEETMNETLNTIHELRTIHGNFTEQEISAQDLKTILAASVRAANASNRQSYSIIVVEDRKNKGCKHRSEKKYFDS